ncbi:hypothetical protein [Leeuwenhoekiella nanhaiensis]|uniref:Uncharacterized protein n=1 Tax=Leeuwenhoekiella nanhaiensis TaxID=1655491 RepID=A0A2G1VW18_9FLAO|nr:hypothetical protein [Leeuwenhoekiella nanhaiensis]PHQ30972.1 hypothetical protein CJ305_01725 [Leeuwenhoekiella nanhaiensis]
MDQNEYEYYSNLINEISDQESEHSTKLIDWVKHIVTILIALLSVLVAFGATNDLNGYLQIIFSAILISIGIGIFSGVVFGYKSIDELSQISKNKRIALYRRLSGETDNLITIPINRKWYFKLAEIVFLLSSSLSIILLVIYGVLK